MNCTVRFHSRDSLYATLKIFLESLYWWQLLLWQCKSAISPIVMILKNFNFGIVKFFSSGPLSPLLRILFVRISLGFENNEIVGAGSFVPTRHSIMLYLKANPVYLFEDQ